MRVAIVYESKSGTTKAAAEKMADVVRKAGHECAVESIAGADAKRVAAAQAIVFGGWVKGLYIFRQRPSEGIISFVNQMTISNRRVATFVTYRIAAGSALRQLASAVESSGGKVTGMYQVKGANVPQGFERWVDSLDNDAAI